MKTVDVRIKIDAPPEKVWEILTDYEGWTFFKEISKAELLKRGKSEKAGVGAVRKLRLNGLPFVEEITAFEPPKYMEYVLEKSAIPGQRETARNELSMSGNGTELRWSGQLELEIPVIGRMLEPVLQRMTRKTFQSFIEQVKAKAER